MKKLFLLSILLSTSLFQAVAGEWTDPATGIKWTFSNNGYGVGTGFTYVWTITAVENYGDNLIVPGTVYNGGAAITVEAIADNLFKDNITLTTISLPTSLKYIGNSAFSGCTALMTVNGNANCERIEPYAFRNCNSLTSINLSGCKYVGYEAFVNCQNLSSVVSLAACTTIDHNAFYSCRSLQSVDLNDNVSIGGYAFSGCNSLTSVGSLKGSTIAYYAFQNCTSLTTVDISQSASVGSGAFFGCSSLTTVGDLSGYTAIPEYLFNGCTKLNNVNLSNVTTIGNSAFAGCASLTTIDLPKIKTIGNSAFYNCLLLNDLTITSTALTNIGTFAFNSAGTLTLQVTTPPVLEASNAIGTLMVVRVPDPSVAAYRTADKWSDFATRIFGQSTQINYNVNVTAQPNHSGLSDAVGEDNLGTVVNLKITGTINGYDIMVMRNKMPNLHYLDLKDVDIVANDYEYYTGYHTDNNVLGARSFCYQEKLIEVKLPQTITSIGSYAFCACTNLKKVEFNPGIVSIGNRAFIDCSNLTELDLKSGLKSIGNDVFGGWYEDKAGSYHTGAAPKFTEVILPEGLESIGSEAFYRNSNLKLIAFPSTLKAIGYSAFQDCSQLLSISIPTSLQRIEDNTFNGCSSLTEVHIPSTIISIGDKAFYGCSRLNDIYTYIADPTPINMNTFSTYTTATVYIPSTSKYNYWYDTEWSQFYKLELLPDVVYKYFYVNKDFTIGDEQGTVQGEDGNAPDVDLNPGSGLIVETTTEDQDLDEVHLISNDEQSGSIISNNNLNVNKFYIDITVKKNTWYFFSFPYRITLADIHCEGSWVFRAYDGEARANNGYGGWKKLPVAQQYLTAGQGYIFQCSENGTLQIPVDKEQYGKFSGQSAQQNLNNYASNDPENASWNFMGQPYPCYFDIDMTDFDSPITIWNGYSYETVRKGDDEYHFRPFEGYFVQKPNGKNVIAFDESGRHTYQQWNDIVNNKQQQAPRRSPEETSRWLINLTLSDGQFMDKTRVVYNESCTTGYDLGADAAKFITSDVPQLYSLDGRRTRYAINERPEGEVQLGFVATKKGNLTIAAKRLDKAVVLRDNMTGSIFDLTNGEYTFITEAGTFNDRFVLLTGNVTSISTVKPDNADNNDAPTYTLDGKPVKEMKANRLYIKDGQKVIKK